MEQNTWVAVGIEFRAFPEVDIILHATIHTTQQATRETFAQTRLHLTQQEMTSSWCSEKRFNYMYKV